VLVLQAGLEGDEVRARIQSAEFLDEAVSRHHKLMRVFVRGEEPIGSVESRLRERGEGEVSLVLILDSGEVEVKLPGRYQVTPQIAGALRAAPGVVHVEMS
jgi:DNA polymerase-3 subunit alpha